MKRHHRRGLKRRYGHATVHKTRKYNVSLHGKWIDAVFHNTPGARNREEREDDVKRSLVNHDGYDSAIKVTEVRK